MRTNTGIKAEIPLNIGPTASPHIAQVDRHNGFVRKLKLTISQGASGRRNR